MTLQCGLAIASMSAPQLELITARWRMDLEDAYGWLAVPAKILEVCENVLSDIGVPVGPWLAQSIVLMVAAAGPGVPARSHDAYADGTVAHEIRPF